MKKISIVVPCYNEEESIPLFYKEVKKVFSEREEKLEIIFVNDGSRDKSLEVIVLNLCIIFSIKKHIDSLILYPVFAEVLKLPMKLLELANPLRLTKSFTSSFFNKSALFSTKTQGIYFPSKNLSASSTEFFQLIVLY